MDKAWGWVKEHPYIAAAIVFVVGLFIILVFFRGSGAQSDGSGAALAAYQQARATEAASGNQLAGMQLGAAAATNQTNSEAAVASQKIASDERLAKIAADAAMYNTKYTTDSAVEVAKLTTAAGIQVSTINATLEGKKASLGVLDSLYQTLVKQNPAWIVDNSHYLSYTTTDGSGGDGGNYHTETSSNQINDRVSGSYGQGVSGSIGDLPFAINVLPGLSRWTPWGVYPGAPAVAPHDLGYDQTGVAA